MGSSPIISSRISTGGSGGSPGFAGNRVTYRTVWMRLDMRLQSGSTRALALILLPLAPAIPQLVPTQPSHLTVLITASTESDTSTSATGATTQVGHAVIGTAGAFSSTYEHSEVWEVIRRFTDECPAASFVTNPQTPHNFTIHTDYQKIHSAVLGTVILYQLVLLDGGNNPLLVTKKDWLRREVKPICKMIEQKQVK